MALSLKKSVINKTRDESGQRLRNALSVVSMETTSQLTEEAAKNPRTQHQDHVQSDPNRK